MWMNQTNRGSFGRSPEEEVPGCYFSRFVLDIAEEARLEGGVGLLDVNETSPKRSKNARMMFAAGRANAFLTPSSARKTSGILRPGTARSPANQARGSASASPHELAVNLQPAGTVDCVDKHKHGQGGCREGDNRREGHNGLKADNRAGSLKSAPKCR